MKKNLSAYMKDFDEKYSTLKEINSKWYENEIGIKSFCKKSKTRDNKNRYSEEYIRARLVWSLVNSGMYQKEYICVEFSIPKGNKAKSVKPDIIVFKNKNWSEMHEDAKKNNDFSEIRKNILVVFESKKNKDTVDLAIENQL